jgi:hypothetical protein
MSRDYKIFESGKAEILGGAGNKVMAGKIFGYV